MLSAILSIATLLRFCSGRANCRLYAREIFYIYSWSGLPPVYVYWPDLAFP